MSGRARAVAHPNFALAKYWGKADVAHNVPAVPSLSVTLDAMSTTTSVSFEPGLDADEVTFRGAPAADAFAARVTRLLDRVRAEAGLGLFARVETANDFPTAAGLASSASGFAALALAATAAAGLEVDAAGVSDLARRSSASAARSVFGGYAVLPAGAPGTTRLPAEPLFSADHMPLAITIAVTTEAEKSVGSTDGMGHTAATSPYYAAWVDDAPRTFARIRAALAARDFEALAAASEASALTMHACALAARPGLLYWNPTTVRVLDDVRAMRRSGLAAFFTIDAGPHVKILSHPRDADAISARVASLEGVVGVLRAAPGEGARLLDPAATDAP